MDPGLIAALRSLRTRQAAERLATGEAYDQSGYVACDELGSPLAPGWYSRQFGKLAVAAGVRRIPLHGARHTACSLTEKPGVPVSVISKWAGHYSGAFTMATYVHADGDDLAMGADVLAGSTRPEVGCESLRETGRWVVVRCSRYVRAGAAELRILDNCRMNRSACHFTER